MCEPSEKILKACCWAIVLVAMGGVGWALWPYSALIFAGAIALGALSWAIIGLAVLYS